MTIRFEFTLRDVDASNLIDILHQEETRALDKARSFLVEPTTKVDQANADWYSGHADYLASLRKTVAEGSTRI